MKTKFSGILTLLLAFVVQLTFAQEKTISGTISDQSGVPLPGVNIIVKGTTTGTQSDFDGNYSISAATGSVLTFSYVGLTTQEVTVGAANTVNVTMQEDLETLSEVIVTAQGIKREKKALGYAVSEVAAEDIEQRTEGDVARVLSGKASGVNIQSQSGTTGSGTNVVIRGYTSISGSNQALFIVDGVPFSSDTNAQGSFVSGNVGSSRFLDLDPNNIESVNVLKGLAAATLYGTAGKNGVIVITTKSGSSAGAGPSKTEITVNQSYFFNEIASLPNYQQQYGGGFNQSFGWFFSNWGPSFSPGGVDGYLNDPAGIIDANGTVPHPYDTSAFLNGSSQNFGNNILAQRYNGVRYDWRPYNSVEEFFRTGGVSNTSINVRGASTDGKITYNVNYGHLDEKGFTPGNGQRRNTLSVGGTAKLSNKITASATLNFSRNDVTSPPVATSFGNGTAGWSTFGNVFFTPINVDLMGLEFEIPETGGSIYYRNGNDIINPRWSVKNANNDQLTNRVFGTAQLMYEFNDNLNLTYRAGIDFYNERNQADSNKGGVNFTNAINGFLNTWDNNNRIWDHYLAIGGNYDLSEKVGVTFTAGATSRSTEFDQQGVASSGQLVYGVKRHFNYANQAPIQFSVDRNIIGVFGEAAFDYDNMLYITLSGRNDWVSNLPTTNNNLFYPSISASFLPTVAFPEIKSDGGLNYLKLRAGLGQSAGFPTGYPVSQNVLQFTQQNGGAIGGATGIITNSLSNSLANPDLKPELVSEFEVGFDARIWRNRINVSFSYFDRETTDLIIGNKPLPPSAGFTTTQANIGKIESDGIEVDLSLDILRSDGDGLNWNSRVNFTKSKEIVTELDDDQIIYTGFTDPGNAAIEGEQLGVIVGSRVLRDANGNLVVSSAGNYQTENQVTLDDGRVITPIIGNPNPDYVMNFINSLSFKNFNLGFQISHTAGGDVYSSTVSVLQGRGLIVTDRKNSFILPGVRQDSIDGSGVGQTANNVQINNSTYYFNNVLFGPSELQVYDGSVVRLQELSLGYTVPQKWLERTPFGTLSFTASGFNLWHDAYNTPDDANFDPNVAGTGIGNGRGFDFINGPSSRKYGFSIKASF
ncbi:MAG: SusC/RagA family TonB-linked outer membrane protein [Bacteroidia bacterium]|nr:SusC/RagA family TonB-linked outer membrane protein [Bacteroidia bacterium]